MSVLLETGLGDLVVDLEVKLCPKTSENFLKLCMQHLLLQFLLILQKDFIAQTGDPTDLGTGGKFIYAQLERSDLHSDYGNQYFSSELATQKAHKSLNHGRRGTLAMAVSEGKHQDLSQINNSLVDDQGQLLRDIRLRHVIVLDDPFDDPPGILIPSQSPAEPSSHQGKVLRVGDDEELDQELDPEVVEERRREREARAQALTLKMVGDLPFAEVVPPENILFVCKLNSITRSEDLELIFSRFGNILSCEVIKDAKTGDSLQYAFIEFDQREDAERAYFKIDGVLIDDRRIHVDFSQSVSKLLSDWIFKRTEKRVRPNQTYEHRPKKRQPSERSPPRARRDSKYEMTLDVADLIECSAQRSDHRRYDDRCPHSSRDNRSNHRQDSRAHHDFRHNHSRRQSRSPTRRHR
ncbi:Peptidyl-prolyl cis-trans isomerase cyp6 [Puccinia graminis f. sp. tritici]|uniref:Peptidyl-prolyl cis-trans isomerase n=1 Tax=Puccinia graminis f. sp. tritici TaxID=56615 RepID=A0A5B0QS78_PUCGR|nr:Peptidyl-prolyl cis-trans isomerase cyp6 [Puccinia graminis f. sp. tritici]